MKISQFQQYAVFAVFALFGLIFVYYQFIIKPLNLEIATLQADLADKQKKLDEAKQTVAKYDEFKKHSAEVERQLEWALGRMPTQLDRPAFAETINNLQTRSGVALTKFSFVGAGVPSKDAAYTEVPASISFTGTYQKLLSFLKEVTFTKNLIVIHDLRLSSYADTTAAIVGSQSTLSAQMVLGGIQGKK